MIGTHPNLTFYYAYGKDFTLTSFWIIKGTDTVSPLVPIEYSKQFGADTGGHDPEGIFNGQGPLIPEYLGL